MGFPAARKTLGLHWLHWLVVVSSLGLTVVAWYISSTQTDEKLRQRFEFQSQQLLELVSEQMSRYEDALKAGVATMNLYGNAMNERQWKQFAEHLQIDQRYPGINGIGVIFHVKPGELLSYLVDQRMLRPDYDIHPSHDNGEYWPITFVEPAETNRKAIGLDIAFESNRLTGAQRARDTQSTQITAPIVLVQDARETPGFLLYVPFYADGDGSSLADRRERFVGHVYAPFIMYKLVEGTLSQANRELAFSIYDGTDVLYDELLPDNGHYDANPLFSKQVSVDMYGRPWTFTIQTSQAFRNGAEANQPLFILVGGIIIDSMLLALFVVLSRSRSRAIALAEDMAARSKINETYFRRIIEAAPCGILIVDREGNIEQVNTQANTMLDYAPEELIGQPVERLVPDEVRPYHENLQQSYHADAGARKMGLGLQVSCRRKDGSTFPVEIGLATLNGEVASKVIVTIVDVTRHVELTDDLERSNRDLNDFAYVASHDLKAPLRGIVQISNWIAEDLVDVDLPGVADNLVKLKGRAQRMSHLLDDLLAYAQAGQISGGTRSTDVEQMLRRIFEMQTVPDGFRLGLEPGLPVFETYPVPLESVFRNLIGNAVKHHDSSGGAISVSCRELPHVYEFTVRDDGPGIDPAMQSKVFELFTTLKPRDVVEGSGMGLSIVNKILDSFRCRIRVESDGIRGTAFIFTWPKSVDTDVVQAKAA